MVIFSFSATDKMIHSRPLTFMGASVSKITEWWNPELMKGKVLVPLNSKNKQKNPHKIIIMAWWENMSTWSNNRQWMNEPVRHEFTTDESLLYTMFIHSMWILMHSLENQPDFSQQKTPLFLFLLLFSTVTVILGVILLGFVCVHISWCFL